MRSLPSAPYNDAWLLNGLLVTGLAVLAFLSLFLGRGGNFLFQELGAVLQNDAETAWFILREIRLPRCLLAILVGASLGVCGAALQGLLRNPLAEPGLIGVSSGAALGAVVIFYFGLASAHVFILPLGGMAGAAVALCLIFLLVGRDPDIGTLILAGVAISALSGAFTALALNFADNPYAALEIVFWMLGSLTDRSLEHVGLALPFILLGLSFIAAAARGLDALVLGEEAAQSLGFNRYRLRFLIVVGTGLAVGACVSVTGIIGFVGLVVPHLVRPLAGQRPSVILVPSALAGANMLLAADLLVRLLSPTQELKIGVMTALIGAPFLVHLLRRLRREGMALS
jgi:iron complex transport system permease protein